MQKRRVGGGGGGGGGSLLPMTEADLHAQPTQVTTQSSGGGKRSVKKRRKVRKKTYYVCGPMFWGFVMIGIVLMLIVFLINGWHQILPSPIGGGAFQEAVDLSATRERRDSDVDRSKLPLSNFPTVRYALDNTDLVALYYAASWCPMSTPVTEALDMAFSSSEMRHRLLPNPPGGVGGDSDSNHRLQQQHFPLGIVYISSDQTEKEMSDYTRDYWINVPYKSDSDERQSLKKHFRVCAKRELDELEIDRRHEIPTLIILDSVTHGVLSTNGVEDLKEHGEKALDGWLELQSLLRAQEDKYGI